EHRGLLLRQIAEGEDELVRERPGLDLLLQVTRGVLEVGPAGEDHELRLRVADAIEMEVAQEREEPAPDLLRIAQAPAALEGAEQPFLGQILGLGAAARQAS